MWSSSGGKGKRRGVQEECASSLPPSVEEEDCDPTHQQRETAPYSQVSLHLAIHLMGVDSIMVC